MIRVLLVDDHPLVLDGIRAVLESDSDMEVVGAATSSAEALALVRAELPDIAVVDVRLVGESGLDLITDLQAVSPLTECMVLTVSDDAHTVDEALSRGAHGYLLKGASREDIRLAVRRVATGRSHIDPAVSGHLANMDRSSRDRRPALTARGLAVLKLAAKGMTNEAIANHLGISTETVKTHLSRAFVRLGVQDRTSAVAVCIRRGLF